MSSVASHYSDSQIGRARFAVALFFFTNGIVVSSLVPHFPSIKSELGLSNSLYGIAIAAIPTGAIVAGPAAGWFMRKLGSARISFVFTVVGGLVLLTVPFASAVAILIAVFFLLGAADAITDVGQNGHALEVQQAYGKSIINRFHAIWSVGALTGGSLGVLTIAVGIPRTVHLLCISVLVTVLSFAAYKGRLPDGLLLNDEPDTSSSNVPLAGAKTPGKTSPNNVSRGKILIMLTAFSLIAIAGALVEDSGSTWAAVYLQDSLGAVTTIATCGYIALVGSQFIGRILGDGFIDRWGQRNVVQAGGLLIAVGMGIALAFPSIALTIIGFGLAGFGSATLVPAAYQGANEIPGLKPGNGLTIVSWLLRLGFLVSPPLVGLIADNSSLRLGLLVLPTAGLLTFLCAFVLTNKPPTKHTPPLEPSRIVEN